MKTIDMTPTWLAATRIYIEVLQNPTAGSGAHKAAKEDLLSLARGMDKIIAERKKEKQE